MKRPRKFLIVKFKPSRAYGARSWFTRKGRKRAQDWIEAVNSHYGIQGEIIPVTEDKK